MKPRILIAGGYGLVGGTIARHLRKIAEDAEIVLAGRNPEKGAALVRELGNAGTVCLDVDDSCAVDAVGPVDLIVSALYDPANNLIEGALRHGIAHIGITTKADDVAPVAFAALKAPPKRPIVLLGHCAAGVATLVAQKAAAEFGRVDSIAVTALFDIRDAVGPMTAGDAEMLVGRALLRAGGKWAWVDGMQHPRYVGIADGMVLDGLPTALLDVPSLAAMTGAPDVRLDMVQGDSLGSRRGGPASSDLYIDIEGRLASGAPAARRIVVSDPNGLAHLTALGTAVAAERVLGLDGASPPPGGLYLPETLLSPDAAVARYEQLGVRVMEPDLAHV